MNHLAPDVAANEPWKDATTYRGGTVKFEIARSNSKKEPFFWRIVAANGQTLATSEMYTRKASCVSAIASIQKNADAKVVDLTAE